MSDERERLYLAALSEISELGPVRTKLMLERFGSAEKIFNADREELRGIKGIGSRIAERIKDSKDLDQVRMRFNTYFTRGTRCVFLTDESYPDNLFEIYDPPPVMFFKGNLPKKGEPLVAVVGSRSPSEYGKNIAYKLAFKLAEKGVGIVSGLAAGIDAFAHKGALDAGGRTYAVLGSGVDVPYPPVNIDLYNRIMKQGGVISEVRPSEPPLSGNFPSRNRIISGMADALIVVEARKRSGSLITADQAMEQGRAIFAVPGRMTDLLSEGCNGLIKEGAYLLAGIQDILDIRTLNKKIITFNKIMKNMPETRERADLRPESGADKNVYTKTNVESDTKNDLATTNYLLYSCLNLEPMSFNTIVEKSGMSPSEVAVGLIRLQIEEKVREITPNMFVRIDI